MKIQLFFFSVPSPRSELEILKRGGGGGGGSRKRSTSAKTSKAAMVKQCEPLARRIERRKALEKQKMMDGNVTRLIRAVKSVVVELQLCVWDWGKNPTFKSKDVARGRRIKLRRTLHRLLDDHRHAVMNLVGAVRNWVSTRGGSGGDGNGGSSGCRTFMWNDEWDVLDLVRRMPFLIGSSSDGARNYMPGSAEAHESEFGLSFLAEVDVVVDFLGFAVGHGDNVRRIDGALDCNMMVLIPEDRVRALRLLGEDQEADHMAASILMTTALDEDEDDEEDAMFDAFPYSCAEDMPLVCRLCHAGERTMDGKCPNCGHVGGDDWKELDDEARVQRYQEEKEWFVEEQEEKIRQKAELKKNPMGNKKKGDSIKPSDVKYQPKISDKDLLKIAKVHRAVLSHHLTVQEAAGEGARYESKMDAVEDDGYGEEDGYGED